MKKLLLATTLISLSLPALQGCVPAVATGIGAGALMIVDRRAGETYLADEAIEIRSFNRISEKFGDKVHVNVTSYNMKALLTGEVPDEGIKAELEKAIAGVINVKGVTNEVTVGGISSFSARSIQRLKSAVCRKVRTNCAPKVAVAPSRNGGAALPQVGLSGHRNWVPTPLAEA